jgi:pyruvate ferredoxin oxidoreductase gamma subunit
MKEIRIHARAGQGAITTAMILGEAVFASDKYALAFPNFGAARMGAPMNAFVRIDSDPIKVRSQIYEPDYLIVIDPTLTRGFDIFSGLKKDGIVVINKRKGIDTPKHDTATVIDISANEIAQKIIGRPLGNTVLLGAFAAATGEIELNILQEAVKKRFRGKVGEKNAEAVKVGFETVKKEK